LSEGERDLLPPARDDWASVHHVALAGRGIGPCPRADGRRFLVVRRRTQPAGIGGDQPLRRRTGHHRPPAFSRRAVRAFDVIAIEDLTARSDRASPSARRLPASSPAPPVSARRPTRRPWDMRWRWSICSAGCRSVLPRSLCSAYPLCPAAPGASAFFCGLRRRPSAVFVIEQISV